MVLLLVGLSPGLLFVFGFAAYCYLDAAFQYGSIVMTEVHPTKPVTMEMVEELIAAEIPKGTEKAEVERFLTRHGFEFQARGRDWPPETPIRARVNGVGFRVLMRWDLELAFDFDSRGRLRESMVKVHIDGP